MTWKHRMNIQSQTLKRILAYFFRVIFHAINKSIALNSVFFALLQVNAGFSTSNQHKMSSDTAYDDIRPYRDEEYPSVIGHMLDSPTSDLLISTVFPELPVDLIKEQLKGISTIKEFQENVIHEALLEILNRTTTAVTRSGLENVNKDEAYLFISNHRDIVLDPSVLNSAIIEVGLEAAEIAIGDNLLQTPWVKDLARLNKSFIVKRNLSVRELMIASRHLSNYIHETIVKRHQCVWIAQREGRAKDGDDRTQAGVLNMLGMSAEEGLREHYANLNIVPVSISYEHDPCDVDKARSLYSLKYFGGYTKEKNEDNLAMRKGILGDKGNVHIHLGKPIKRSGPGVAERFA